MQKSSRFTHSSLFNDSREHFCDTRLILEVPLVICFRAKTADITYEIHKSMTTFIVLSNERNYDYLCVRKSRVMVNKDRTWQPDGQSAITDGEAFP